MTTQEQEKLTDIRIESMCMICKKPNLLLICEECAAKQFSENTRTAEGERE